MPIMLVLQRTEARLVRWRVRLTALIIVLLVALWLWSDLKPHSLIYPNDLGASVGLSLALTGLAIRSWAAGVLSKNSRLTTVGPYAIVRNPLYVGSFLIMAGMMTLLNFHLVAFAVFVPLGVLYFLQIRSEEVFLAKEYGKHWHAYARRVPRLLPFLNLKRALTPWTFRAWCKNREYRALVAVIVGVIAVELGSELLP